MSFLTNNFRIIAKTLPGLEEVLGKELMGLGAAAGRQITRGFELSGDKRLLYKMNYCSRTALRFLVPLDSFRAENENILYRNIRKIPWHTLFGTDQTFAVQADSFSSRIRHSHYLALKSKDAIADRFREVHNKRPSVNTIDPDIVIYVHLNKDFCTVSLDSSGSSLHLRGYRDRRTHAPLNEVLAAGMIDLTGWNGGEDLYDPMCGSGTLLIEAVLKALRIPPGKTGRTYGFMKWSSYDPALWRSVRQDADSRILDRLPCRVLGSDKDGRMLSATRAHGTNAGILRYVSLGKGDFIHMDPPVKEGMVITNPPYGDRIPLDDPPRFYKAIGDTLKQRYTGYTAWILTAGNEAAKHIGLRTSRKIKLYNGQLECRFLRFDMYAGSKKDKTGKERG